MRLRLAFRLARRELRRRPWRSALVLLMVLIPAAAMTVVVTYLRTTEWSAADAARATYGQADATALPTVGAGNVEELRAGLPAGSRVLVERTLYDRVSLDEQRTYLQVSDLALDDPMVDGRFTDVDGRLPRTEGEAVVTRSLAEDLGIGRGGRLEPERLGRTVTVVGTVQDLADNAGIAYVVQGSVPDHDEGFTTTLLDLPDGEAPPSSIGPWTIGPAYDGDGEDKTTDVFWTYVGGGVGLVVLATVITAAFAVGARRQLRSVGLLAASGASPTTVRWFLVAQGAVAGAIGSLLGIAAAVAATRMAPQWLVDSLAGRPVEGVTTRPADVVPIALVSVVVASVAAWLPARSTARIPTLQALAGRRPLPQVPKRLPLFGALGVAAGCALLAMAVAGSRDEGSSLWALVAIAGALGVLLGSIATAPYAVAGLERASASMPGAWRLAGRSLARSRVRSSAVIGAICAVATTVVALGSLHSSEQQEPGDPVPNLGNDQLIVDHYGAAEITADVRRRVERIVGTEGRWVALRDLVPVGQEGRVDAPIANVIAGDGVWRGVAEATPDLLDLFEVPGVLRAALRRGEAIAVTGSVPGDQPVEVTLPAANEAGVAVLETIDLAGTFDSPAAAHSLPTVLVSQAATDRLGLVSRPPTRTLVVAPEALNDSQRDALWLLSEDLSWEGATSLVYVEGPSTGPSAALVKAGLLAVSLALVLAVVAVGLALAATDSEDERQVLAAVGAPPRTLRRVAALRGVLLVLIAVAISVPAGLLSAASIVAAGDGSSSSTFRPDGWGLLFMAVLVPVAVGLAVWGSSRLRDAFRPSRPDVFAFGGLD